MPKVTIYVTLKPGLLDAQGRTVEGALHSLGYDDVSSVRFGKVIELQLPDAPQSDLMNQVSSMCERFLANPVTESYRIEVDA